MKYIEGVIGLTLSRKKATCSTMSKSQNPLYWYRPIREKLYQNIISIGRYKNSMNEFRIITYKTHISDATCLDHKLVICCCQRSTNIYQWHGLWLVPSAWKKPHHIMALLFSEVVTDPSSKWILKHPLTVFHFFYLWRILPICFVAVRTSLGYWLKISTYTSKNFQTSLGAE